MAREGLDTGAERPTRPPRRGGSPAPAGRRGCEGLDTGAERPTRPPGWGGTSAPAGRGGWEGLDTGAERPTRPPRWGGSPAPAGRARARGTQRALSAYSTTEVGKDSRRHSASSDSPVSKAAASRSRSSTRRILPEMVLGSSKNSIRRTRSKAESCSRAWERIAPAVSAGRLPARSERDVRLDDVQPARVRRRHDGGFRDGRVLQEHALDLERRDLVVRTT